MWGMKIVLLGAAGFVGRAAARALAERPGVEKVVLADYVVRDAKRFARSLSPRCAWAMVDVGRAPDLERLLDGIDGVASAVGPCDEYEKGVLSVCAARGIPVASIGDGTLSPAERGEIHDAFRRKGVAAVSGCGMMPGWTDLLADRLLPGRGAGTGETEAGRFLFCRPDRFGGYAFFRRTVRGTGEAADPPPASPPGCWFAMGEGRFGLPSGRPSSGYRKIAAGMGTFGGIGRELSAAFLFWLRGTLKPDVECPVAAAGAWTGGGRYAVVEDARGDLAGILLAEAALKLAAGAAGGKGLLPLPAVIGREEAERIAEDYGGKITAG